MAAPYAFRSVAFSCATLLTSHLAFLPAYAANRSRLVSRSSIRECLRQLGVGRNAKCPDTDLCRCGGSGCADLHDLGDPEPGVGERRHCDAGRQLHRRNGPSMDDQPCGRHDKREHHDRACEHGRVARCCCQRTSLQHDDLRLRDILRADDAIGCIGAAGTIANRRIPVDLRQPRGDPVQQGFGRPRVRAALRRHRHVGHDCRDGPLYDRCRRPRHGAVRAGRRDRDQRGLSQDVCIRVCLRFCRRRGYCRSFAVSDLPLYGRCQSAQARLHQPPAQYHILRNGEAGILGRFELYDWGLRLQPRSARDTKLIATNKRSTPTLRAPPRRGFFFVRPHREPRPGAAPGVIGIRWQRRERSGTIQPIV